VIRQRSRKRLALLCARLAALQEESIGANQAQLIAVDRSLASDEKSTGARTLAELVNREAGQAIGEYVASAETAGLMQKTLHFVASELSPNRPNAWVALLLGAEVGVLIAVSFFYSFFVVPSYQKLFADFGAPMPAITRFMFGLLSPTSPFNLDNCRSRCRCGCLANGSSHPRASNRGLGPPCVGVAGDRKGSTYTKLGRACRMAWPRRSSKSANDCPRFACCCEI
jgi:hypothetical protein